MPARTIIRAAFGVALFAGGCVHSYQPLSGLHRPVVVDTQAANFEDLRLEIVCVPGGLIDEEEAELLCDRVGRLFQNQGATVSTRTGGEVGGTDLVTAEDEAAPSAAPAPTTDLVLELRSREVHARNGAGNWILCIASGTLIPLVSESTFAQEVVVRDGTGFLLAADRLEGRIVRTIGVTQWAGNKLLDIGKKPEDRSKDDAVHARLSADLYGQLSQVVFNAKMRWQVLREATPAGRATGVAP